MKLKRIDALLKSCVCTCGSIYNLYLQSVSSLLHFCHVQHSSLFTCMNHTWLIHLGMCKAFMLYIGFISGGGGPGGASAPPRNWLFRPFNMGLPLLGFVFAPPP